MNLDNHLESLLVVRPDDLLPERQHVVVLLPEENEAVCKKGIGTFYHFSAVLPKKKQNLRRSKERHYGNTKRSAQTVTHYHQRQSTKHEHNTNHQ